MTESIDTIFRIEEDGAVTAFFPKVPASGTDSHVVLCYAHVGQHGSAVHEFYATQTRPCAPADWLDLYSELCALGYSPVVRQRWTYQMDQARRDRWAAIRAAE
jgi:hypothetical protein